MFNFKNQQPQQPQQTQSIFQSQPQFPQNNQFPQSQPFSQTQPQSQMQSNLALPNNNFHEQIQYTYILDLLKFVYECQTSNDMQNVLPFLVSQQRQILQQFDDCARVENVVEHEEQYLKSVKDRCLKLKNNNEIILMEMLNIKQRIGRALPLSIDRSSEKEEEFNMVQQKIRRNKMQLVNKIQHIKTKRLLAQSNGARPQSRPDNRFRPINIALTELKDATEVIDRELIRQREQIRALIKTLYDEDV